MATIINKNEINFESGTAVVSVVKKFIIPVGKFEKESGGESLVYPQGHKDAGQQILDYEKKPIGAKGIIHINRGESIAAAPSDGQSVMIINSVKDEDAVRIKSKIDSLGGDPTTLSLAQFKEVLAYAKSLGYEDIYNSTHENHSKTFASTDELKTRITGYSYGKRNDEVEVKAVFIPGDIQFVGESRAAGGVQNHPKGAMVIFNPKSPLGDQKRTVDVSELKTYSLPNGDPIVVDGPGANIAMHDVGTQGHGGAATSPEPQRKLG